MSVRTEIMTQTVAKSTYKATDSNNVTKLTDIVKKDLNTTEGIDTVTKGFGVTATGSQIKIVYKDNKIYQNSIKEGIPKKNGEIDYTITLEEQSASLMLEEESTPQTGEKDWETIKETATKHPNQSAENNDIGIDADGNICNLDLWNYEEYMGVMILGSNWNYADTSSICYAPFHSGWESSEINVEKNNLVLPKCIKFDGESEFKDITYISNYAFYDCDTLSSVVIPDTITALGYSCFAECSSLASIDIPRSVINTDGDCFLNCTSLDTVKMYTVESSNGKEFSGCSNLTTIIMRRNNCSRSWVLVW